MNFGPMEKHLTIVAVLRIGWDALGILLGLAIFGIMIGSGLVAQDPDAVLITGLIGAVVGGFLILVSVPGIIGGIGLLRRARWARILVLIMSVFDLFFIPIGTMIGIYIIWVLMQDETVELLGRP